MIRIVGASCVAIFLLFLYGCSQPAEQKSAGPAVPPVLSINAEMVSLVDHAAHELWDVEKEGHAPATDQDWEEVQHHAMQLQAAGTLITLGGTGQADPGWAKSPDWAMFARKLIEAAQSQASAAQAKNQEGLVKANGQLVEVCEGCHKEFKPELPTEGIVHPHYRR